MKYVITAILRISGLGSACLAVKAVDEIGPAVGWVAAWWVLIAIVSAAMCVFFLMAEVEV